MTVKAKGYPPTSLCAACLTLASPLRVSRHFPNK